MEANKAQRYVENKKGHPTIDNNKIKRVTHNDTRERIYITKQAVRYNPT